MKTYTELITLPTFEKRLDYLICTKKPGEITFGTYRYLNQVLYKSQEWKSIRNKVILRDDGCDLGIAERPIPLKAYVHHIEPLTEEDILNRTDKVLSMNNLITVSFDTHQAIHYIGAEKFKMADEFKERYENDQAPWRLL